MRAWLILVCMMVLGACAEEPPPEKVFELTGTVNLNSRNHMNSTSFSILQRTDQVGGPCSGGRVSSGFSDIRGGADVTVTDGDGSIIATDSLEEGTWTSDWRCSFRFSTVVPEVDFYQVEVSHRGQVRFSASDLEAQNSHVDLVL